MGKVTARGAQKQTWRNMCMYLPMTTHQNVTQRFHRKFKLPEGLQNTHPLIYSAQTTYTKLRHTDCFAL